MARLEPVSDLGKEVLAAVSRVSCPGFIIRLLFAFWYQLHLAIVINLCSIIVLLRFREPARLKVAHCWLSFSARLSSIIVWQRFFVHGCLVSDLMLEQIL